MSNKSKRFPPEFRDCVARMVLEEEKNHPSRWSAVMMIAPKLGIREHYTLSNGSYGRPSMIMELREAGLDVGERRIGRL